MVESHLGFIVAAYAVAAVVVVIMIAAVVLDGRRLKRRLGRISPRAIDGGKRETGG